ncbi:hypothetical protein A3K73_01505 [Candidatus Pacearchaeota archaeon RBG_13_36_9]|nr:MAG: hypothetical protein A3K73_01505 [Candidatus Pacearchaeota archaeon RBG_13_36_9]
MKKEVACKIQPVKKSNNNLILIIAIGALLLIVLFVLAYFAHDYFMRPIEPNEIGPDQTNVNDTTPINGSNINDTSKAVNLCGNGRCDRGENYTNCPKDCKKPGTEGGSSGGTTNPPCTPNKDCAYYYDLNRCGNALSDGCSNSLNCLSCNSGFYCYNNSCLNNSATCVDSDNRNYYIQGNVTINNSGTSVFKEDICLGSLIEFYCYYNGSDFEARNESYNCPHGCFEGACSLPACIHDDNCSGINLTEIETCNYTPDDNPFTLDHAPENFSSCIDNACSAVTYSFTHTCSKASCDAECDSTNSCPATACNDECHGNDYYDYGGDVSNSCLSNCACEHNLCGTPIITYNDPRCTSCIPNCDGKVCGDDGCEDPNGCGTCGTGEICSNGACIPESYDCNDAKVRCVDVGGTKEYLTIQGAVSASSNGNTIVVYPGTYQETVTINTAGITLIGADSSNPPVIDGSEKNFNPIWTNVEGNIYKTPYVWKLDGVEKEHLTENQYTGSGGGSKDRVDIQVYEDGELLRGYKSMIESTTPGSMSGCSDDFGAYDGTSYLDPSKDSWASYPYEGRKHNLQIPGRFFYDNNTNELYVSTENGDSPVNHNYKIPVIFNLLKINSANVKVENIVMQYSSGFAVLLNNAENLIFENNYMVGNQYPLKLSSGSNKIKIKDNLIQNKGWWERYWYYDAKQGGTCGDEIGIFWAGALECILGRSSADAEISGNTISGYYSPFFWGCKNASIHDNIISKYTSVINFFDYNGDDYDLKIYHNIFHDVDFDAIQGKSQEGPAYIYRNIFYKIGSLMKTGYVSTNLQDVYWYHNTVMGSWWTLADYPNTPDEQNRMHMLNNIYYSKGMSDSTSQSSSDKFYYYSINPNIDTDYCIYWDQYTDSSGAGRWDGVSYSDNPTGLTNFANAIAAHNIAKSPLWKAQSEIDALTPRDIKYNLAWDWLSEKDYKDIINDGGFEQQLDLQFQEIYDRFSLQATSPAINSGGQIPASWPHYPLPDTGEITDGKPDMGAVEYKSGSVSTIKPKMKPETPSQEIYEKESGFWSFIRRLFFWKK